MGIEQILSKIANFLWGIPLILTITFIGLYFTVKSGFWQFRHIGFIFKNTIGTLGKSNSSGAKGEITPFQALCTALGGTIGTGNIAGVASAIAVGGPGAVFWMWVSAFLGMIIKMVEVTLAVHYRKVSSEGEIIGGPTFYIENGLGRERGFKYWKIMAILFGTTLFTNAFFTLQNYTVSEAISSAFQINIIVVGAIYMILSYVVILGGLKRISKVAASIVPYMTLLYMAAGLFILLTRIPDTINGFKMIISSAFTGTAAIGGFGGAVFAQAISKGFSRAVNSNEAGQGTAPMAHASAKTDHPIKQALWGAFEVFVDTIVVCTITALAVIVTGVWSNGQSGATLVLSAFGEAFGAYAPYLLSIAIFLFGWTTTTGFSFYYEVLLTHATENNIKLKNKLIKIFRCFYPIPAFSMVVLSKTLGLPPSVVWLVVDISVALPVIVNIVAIFLLRKKFFALLEDFNAKEFGNVKKGEDKSGLEGSVFFSS